MVEVYEYLNGLSPDIVNTIFKLTQNICNLINIYISESQNAKTKKFGLDSIIYRAIKFRQNVPEEVKN